MTDIAKRLREIAGDIKRAESMALASLIADTVLELAKELESQPAGDPAMPEKPPEHVCGSSGFGGSVDDVCHACRWWREKWALDDKTVPMRDHLAAIAAARQERMPAELCQRLQQQCSDWGVYWRAPDAHGVNLSQEQAQILLERALGVGVEIAAPKPDSPEQATPDQVIDLACALEQRRALHIVAEVAALQIGGADSQTPTPFQAGYALACEEIDTRLRTQQWVLGDVPAPLPAPAGGEA